MGSGDLTKIKVKVEGKKFILDNLQAPEINLVRGNIYRFDQSDISNSNYRIKFYLESEKKNEYTEGVKENGIPGKPDAYTEIKINNNMPKKLYYAGEKNKDMGNTATVTKNNFFGIYANYEIKRAVNMWLNDKTRKDIEEKYGHISKWKTSSVTNMSNLFFVLGAGEFFNKDIGKCTLDEMSKPSGYLQ